MSPNKVAGRYIPHNVYDVLLSQGEIGVSSQKKTPFISFSGEILNEMMLVRGMTGSPSFDTASAKVGLDIYVTPKTIDGINKTLAALGVAGIPVPFMGTEPEVAAAQGILMQALSGQIIRVEITGSTQQKFEQDVPMPDGTIARLPRYNDDGTPMMSWQNRVNSNAIVGYSGLKKPVAEEQEPAAIPAE
jgi:hypothetical protein